jgi:hypothetical protein
MIVQVHVQVHVHDEVQIYVVEPVFLVRLEFRDRN